jgi:hypothetical protein
MTTPTSQLLYIAGFRPNNVQQRLSPWLGIVVEASSSKKNYLLSPKGGPAFMIDV